MEKIWLKSYAPGVLAHVDFKDVTLPEALSGTAEKFGQRPALIFQGKVLTYTQLDYMVSRFAQALRTLGVLP